MSDVIDINPILDEIIKATGLTQEEIAQRIHYRPDYLSQARSAGTLKLYNKLVSFSKEFGKSKLSNVEKGEEPQTITELLKSNRVLSEANRTLADANKFLADAHNNIVQLAREAIRANSNKLTTDVQQSPQEAEKETPLNELRRTGRTGPFSLQGKGKQGGSSKKTGN